jgi:antitoxin MazE
MRAAGRARVVKWGNSKAIRLPRQALQQAHLQEGDELTIRVEKGRIALESPAREITLEKLVAAITPRNRHGEQDWGKAVGNETW